MNGSQTGSSFALHDDNVATDVVLIEVLEEDVRLDPDVFRCRKALRHTLLSLWDAERLCHDSA